MQNETATPVYREGKHCGWIQPTVPAERLRLGIQSWSKSGGERLAIISAHRACLSEVDNARRHDQLKQQLEALGADHGVVEGSYKGQTELSYLVSLDDPLTFMNLEKLARRYGQESILFISESRKCILIYSDGVTTDYLGQLKAISPTAIKNYDSWTRTSNGQYYTTEIQL